MGSTKQDNGKHKNSENVLMLESVEVVLMHSKAVNNYQQASKVLFTFVSNNQFKQ